MDEDAYARELIRILASAEQEQKKVNKLIAYVTSASWKTTMFGVAQILSSGAMIAKMLSTGAYDGNTLSLALTGFFTGFGFIVAKDKNVVGAPPTDKAK